MVLFHRSPFPQEYQIVSQMQLKNAFMLFQCGLSASLLNLQLSYLYILHMNWNEKKWKTGSNYSNSKWEGRSRTSTSQTAIWHLKPQTAPQMKENTWNYTHPHTSHAKLRPLNSPLLLLLNLLYFTTVDSPELRPTLGEALFYPNTVL